MKEWRIVKGHPDYIVSCDGEIYSMKKQWKNCKFKRLKYSSTIENYKRVRLWNKNGKHSYLVHRVVAEAFIPNPQNKPFIDHINCIPDDNRVENLRWVTARENMNNPKTIINHNKACKKNSEKRMKGVIATSPSGKTITFESVSEARRVLGWTVTSYCRYEHKCERGWTFRYADDEENAKWLRLYEERIKKPKVKKKRPPISAERRKQMSEARNGKKNLRAAKPVYQYSSDGTFIAKWESSREITRKLGIDYTGVGQVCRGVIKKFHGFIWSHTPL